MQGILIDAHNEYGESDAHRPEVPAKDAVEEVEQDGADEIVFEFDGDGPENVVSALEGEMLP